MSEILQNLAQISKFQLDNLVDFEKCCKMHIYLQKSVPIQLKTSNILPKFAKKCKMLLHLRELRVAPADGVPLAGLFWAVKKESGRGEGKR